MNGRKQDVLIERSKHKDDTGLVIQSDRHFTLWADAGMKDTIESVEGVKMVNVFHPTEYSVFIDPRYDIDFVEREVIATILCRPAA